MEAPRARARGTDPWTSHAAAARVERDSTAATQRAACLAEVLRGHGRTAAEVSAACGFERHVASRRLPELRDAGLIRNGEARVCSIVGRPSLTWWPPHDPQYHQLELV